MYINIWGSLKRFAIFLTHGYFVAENQILPFFEKEDFLLAANSLQAIQSMSDLEKVGS